MHVGGHVLSGAAAEVLLYPESILSGRDAHLAARSILPDGKFEFDGVLPGAYNLLVNTLEGERSASALRSLSVGNAGEDGLTISLSPHIAITGRIRVDGGGDAMDLSKVGIQLWPLYPSAALFHSGAASKGGRFKFANLAPASYRVLFTGTPAGVYLKTMRVGNRDSSGRLLDLSAGAPAEIEVLFSPKAASVTGTVFLPDSERPDPEATVVLILRMENAGTTCSPIQKPLRTNPVNSQSATYRPASTGHSHGRRLSTTCTWTPISSGPWRAKV